MEVVNENDAVIDGNAAVMEECIYGVLPAEECPKINVRKCELENDPELVEGGYLDALGTFAQIVDVERVFEEGGRIETGCWELEGVNLREPVSIVGQINSHGYFNESPARIEYAKNGETVYVIENENTRDVSSSALVEGRLFIDNDETIKIKISRDFEAGREYRSVFSIEEVLRGEDLMWSTEDLKFYTRFQNYEYIDIEALQGIKCLTSEVELDQSWRIESIYGSSGKILSSVVECVDTNDSANALNGEVVLKNTNMRGGDRQVIGELENGIAVLGEIEVNPYAMAFVVVEFSNPGETFSHVNCTWKDLDTSFKKIYFDGVRYIEDEVRELSMENSFVCEAESFGKCQLFSAGYKTDVRMIGNEIIADISCNSFQGNIDGEIEGSFYLEYKNFNESYVFNIASRYGLEILKTIEIPGNSSGVLEVDFTIEDLEEFNTIVMVPVSEELPSPGNAPYLFKKRPWLSFSDLKMEGFTTVGRKENGMLGEHTPVSPVLPVTVMFTNPYSIVKANYSAWEPDFTIIDTESIIPNEPITVGEFLLKIPYSGGYLYNLEFEHNTQKYRMDNFDVNIRINGNNIIRVPETEWNASTFSVPFSNPFYIMNSNYRKTLDEDDWREVRIDVELVPKEDNLDGFQDFFQINLIGVNIRELQNPEYANMIGITPEMNEVLVGTGMNPLTRELVPLTSDNKVEGRLIYLLRDL